MDQKFKDRVVANLEEIDAGFDAILNATASLRDVNQLPPSFVENLITMRKALKEFRGDIVHPPTRRGPRYVSLGGGGAGIVRRFSDDED